MLDEKEIVMSSLREACTALNKSGLLDEPLKVVGIKKMELVSQFAEQVEKLAGAGLEEKLPSAVKETYNTIFADEFVDAGEKGEEEEVTDEPGQEEVKDTKPDKSSEKSKPDKKKASAEMSVFGHRAGTQAAALDEAFAKGASYEQAGKLAGVTAGRARHHLNHLQKDKKLSVKEVKEGVFKVAV